MDATAFFSHVGRCRDGMKMERQEKYRKEQQQANEAATFGSTGSGGKHSHEALNTQVWLHCQNEVISGTGKLSEQGRV
jgi:hypothetical protein